jgi:soluble lytic murein transglycosylase
MSRQLAAALAAVVLVAVVLVLALRPRGDWAVPEHMAGDIAAEVEGMNTEEMPNLAAGLLATDRPWRAARVMRRYRERSGDVATDRLVLSARAEAGWGGWQEVRSLLDDVPALDTHEHGIGLYLLGRGHDASGEPREAAEAYRAFLALSPPAGEMEEERAAARLRLGLALVRSGDRQSGQRELQAAAVEAGGASLWVDLLAADALAHLGDTAAVRQAVSGHDSGLAGLRAWRSRIAAARAAGDLAEARALGNRARAWAQQDATRAEFLVSAGRDAQGMGDVAGAPSGSPVGTETGAAG